MRTSKISKETKRIMSALNPSTSPTLPQRATRSLSRFKHEATTNDIPEDNGVDANQFTNGNEADSPSHTTDLSTVSSRKRKRALSSKPTTTKAEIKVETSTTLETIILPAKRPKKRQPAKKITDSQGKTTIQPPSDWETIYAAVKDMRSRITAPVDTMGCERLADTTASPRDQRFQTLISLMLSSQTKDTVTAAAVRDMQQNLPGGLMLESILAVEPDVLNEFIGKVGFHNTKTKNIKRAAEVLRDTFDNDIPDSIEGLTSLPGVGPKMGYLCLSAAWGRTEGIGVDVHVHRITNLWKWHATKTPEETRVTLQEWLPRECWHEINWLLVGLGQTICLPVGRKCWECDLGTKGLCPSAVGVKKVKGVKEAKVEVEIEE
jgi:endonuclease III